MKILLGISSSIAAYKTPELVRKLLEAKHQVKVVLTENAKAFVTPLTLETLLPNGVFDTLMEPTMQHIHLAKWADIFLIAPASANTMAKLAHGHADDLISAIHLVTRASLVVAPAMNQAMWQHPVTQANVDILKNHGAQFWGPDCGIQACGDEGPGRMLEPIDIVKQLETLTTEPFLVGIKILITAGPTQEAIDPVRMLTNKSSGKMGYALAEMATAAGAEVTLITGPTALSLPYCHQVIQVKSAADMHTAVMSHLQDQHIFIAAAAVADYTLVPALQKIKKTGESITLTLTPTADIVAEVCQRPDKLFVVCFAAETEHVIENAKRKLIHKGADLIVANDISRTDIGFDSNDNEVMLISREHTKILIKASKHLIAKQILKELRP